jgi:hypothetical protein
MLGRQRVESAQPSVESLTSEIATLDEALTGERQALAGAQAELGETNELRQRGRLREIIEQAEATIADGEDRLDHLRAVRDRFAMERELLKLDPLREKIEEGEGEIMRLRSQLAAVGSAVAAAKLTLEEAEDAIRTPHAELSRTGQWIVEKVYRGRVAPPKARSKRDLRLEASRARALRDLATDPEALLFTAEKGGRISSSNLMRRVLKPAAVRAGVGEWVETKKGKRAESWVGFHTFRHTCATLKIVEEGWALEQVQVFLGHASYQTTARFYAHLRSTDAPVPAPIRRPVEQDLGVRVAR